MGGAGATSGPDVSPQPHPGGAGYRRQRPQGAARTKGAGSLERAPEGRCGRAPAPWEGRDRRHQRTPLAAEYSISPIRASGGPYWPRDLRAPVGVPLNRLEEGRKSEPSAGHGDARRSRVAGHGVAAQGWGSCLLQREPRRALACQSFCALAAVGGARMARLRRAPCGRSARLEREGGGGVSVSPGPSGRPRLWAGHCPSSPHRSVLGWLGLCCSLRPPPHSAPIELQSSAQPRRDPSHHPGRPAPARPRCP